MKNLIWQNSSVIFFYFFVFYLDNTGTATLLIQSTYNEWSTYYVPVTCTVQWYKNHAALSEEPHSSIKKHANMLHCNVTLIHSSHSLGAMCQPLSWVKRIQWRAKIIVLASKEDIIQLDRHTLSRWGQTINSIEIIYTVSWKSTIDSQIDLTWFWLWEVGRHQWSLPAEVTFA